jgi:hypothetical protein
MVKEQEDKFEVDPDWVMPQLAELLPNGGRLDHEVRKLHDTYFDTPGAGLRLFGITLRPSSRRLRDWVAVEGSQWHGSNRTAERVAGEDTANRVG